MTQIERKKDKIAIEKLMRYIINSVTKTHGLESEKLITRYVNKRIDGIIRDMIDVATYQEPHEFYPYDESVKMFLINDYEARWGRVTLNRHKQWMNNILLPILCDVVGTGRTGVATAVRIKEITMDALMEFAIENNEDLVWKQTFDFEGLVTFPTRVDSASLRSAILDWERSSYYALDKNKSKLLNNIKMGRSILSSLNDDILLQEVVQAPNGRLYFRGLNLQGCPKVVRHAALGRCHLYDMRVGAFGVLAGIANDYAAKALDKVVNFHHILGYIQHKDAFRMRITKYVYPEETKTFKDIGDFKGFYGYYNIKMALTSIGFGAKRNAKSVWKDQNDKWQKTSLLSAFKGNTRETELFLKCQLITELLDEYLECSKIVLLRLEVDPEFADYFNIPTDASNSQKLAFVYQHLESKIMESFMGIVGLEEVLLPVHDGVYVRNKVNLTDMWFVIDLPFISDKTYVQFDHEHYTNNGVSDTELRIQAHERFMQEQERLAVSFSPINSEISTTSDKKRQIETPWGMIDEDAVPGEYWS